MFLSDYKSNFHFGYVLKNIDLRYIDKKEIDKLIFLLFQYKILIIKSQTLTPKEYENVMSLFGRPIKHILQEFSLPDFANIVKLSDYINPDGKPDGITDGGSYWHTDMSYYEISNVFTSLYAVNATPNSSGTQFLDLQDGLKALIRNDELCNKIELTTGCNLLDLSVIHRFGNRRKLIAKKQPEQYLSPNIKNEMKPVTHPFIKKNLYTGKSALFAIFGSSVCFSGLNENVSQELLNEIEDYLVCNASFYGSSTLGVEFAP